jgi:hypothetical protein
LTATTAIGAWQEAAGSDGKAATLTLTPTPVISGQLLGIAETSATNGATASVAIGPIVEGTYTSGADYYVSGSGGIGVTASPVRVGKAKSTTELVLDLGGNPSAGKVLSGEITVPGAFTWTAPYDGEYVLTFCAGGGSGCYNTGGIANACGGNGGNTVQVKQQLRIGDAVSGSLGSGGTAQTNNSYNGNDGGNTTVTIGSLTYTALGGRGGAIYLSVSGECIYTKPNAQNMHNLQGTCGGRIEFIPDGGSSSNLSFGGLSPLLSITSAERSGSGVGIAGTRGAGGSGGTSTSSGAGGSGVFRWELVIGS